MITFLQASPEIIRNNSINDDKNFAICSTGTNKTFATKNFPILLKALAHSAYHFDFKTVKIAAFS